MDKNPSRARAKTAGLLATLLWVVSIVLTFAVPAHSFWVWLGDALLLVGFWPLLWVWSPGWPWIVFGLLNSTIGFLLEISYHIPTDNFTHEMIVVREHLRDQHSALTWIIIGVISFLFGVGRTVKNVFVWLRRRTK